MALARQTVAERVKPLRQCVTRRGTLGATTVAGELVTLQSDSKWDPTDTSAAQVTIAVAIQGGGDGDEVDLAHWGPVECLTGATVGGLVYGTNTAGEPSHTAGTKVTVVGYAETATILFVQPQIVDRS